MPELMIQLNHTAAAPAATTTTPNGFVDCRGDWQALDLICGDSTC